MTFHFKGDTTNDLAVSPLFFNLEKEAKYLFIETGLSGNSILQWYLYNPEGNLHGQCSCMGNGKKMVIAPGFNIPYGASVSRLNEGEWAIWVVCLASGSPGQAASSWTLDITCGTDISRLPEPEENPAFSWLTEEGDICGGYVGRSYSSLQAWYKGDFHIHTTCSDGKMPPSRINREARGQGLDFFAVTDHNFFHTGWADDTIPVIPGLELTLKEGHFNLFADHGLSLLHRGFLQDMQDNGSLAEKFLRECGAIVSVNHPFMRPWEVTDASLDLSLLDAMEIICDPAWSTWEEAGEKALKAFSILWDKGIQVTGIGGSDLHNPPEEPYEGSDIPARIGRPSTWVFAEELSIKALLEGLTLSSKQTVMGEILNSFE